MPRLRALSLAVALPFLVTAPVFAQAASLVRAIGVAGPPPAPASSSPGDFFATDGALFFLASTPSTDRAVWATDGTALGTELLSYPCLHGCAEDPQFLGHFGRVAFWQEMPSNPYLPVEIWRSDGTRAGTFELLSNDAFDSLSTPSGLVFYTCGSQGCGFWLSDGTVAGTRPLLTFLPLPTSPIPIYAATLTGHRVVFGAGTGSAASPGAKLWVSDGTSAGSFLFATLPNFPLGLVGAGGHVFFDLPGSGGQGDQLWAGDGTPAGTRQVSAFTAAQPFGFSPKFLPVGDQIYFVPEETAGADLWTSDGTPAGTRSVSHFNLGDPVLTPGSLANLGQRLLFVAQDPYGIHLFRTDGTPASTIELPAPNVTPGSLLAIGSAAAGRVLFVASDATHGSELWSTNGTAAGTFPLDLPCPGACSSLPDNVHPFAGGALFNAADSAGNRVLWFTDGTVAGTHRFASVAVAALAAENPYDPSTVPTNLGELDGRAFFPAEDGHGVELWTSDGKSGGTALLADLAVEPKNADLIELTALGDRLFFTASGAPWQSDGTAASTLPVATPSPVLCPLDTGSPRLVAAGGSLLFVCQETDDGLYHIGRTDGTPAGTVLLPTPTADGFAPATAVVGTDLLLLIGNKFWKSDGTAAGTVKIADLPGGISFAQLFQSLGSEAYFELSVTVGEELWRTDGTAAGTRRLLAADCLAYGLQRTPPLARVGSQVYFFTRDCDSVDQLWVTDGTAAGTRAVTSFPAGDFGEGLAPAEAVGWNGRLYFTGFTPDAAFSLFQSDGTAAGTNVLHRLYGISDLTVFAGRLFFAATGDLQGNELWSTDGTEAGTALVRDILPGADSSNPAGLTVAGGRLFFTADDGVHGIELWQTDGNPANPAGTHLVQDIAPEGRSSRPDQLTVAGDRLYFTADDGLSGRALWALPLASPTGCQPGNAGDTSLCLAGNRFRVEIAWQDFQGNTGVGHAVSLTADTGYFWFFDPTNTEVIVKVLDARSLNNAFWVFYGALSNVEYTMTVTDTTTGLTRRYQNPAGNLASVGDTAGFGPLGAFATTTLTAAAAAPAWVSARTDATAATGVCAAGPKRLCLQGNRFAVTAVWKDFQGNTGTGTAVPLSGDTGYFWFFAPTNVEVVTKVLDGRALGGKFWFFYGALSDVEYTLTVTDTQTGAVKVYKNPSGQFGSVADTAAF